MIDKRGKMEKYENMPLYYYNFYKDITYWESYQLQNENIDIDKYDLEGNTRQGKYRDLFENFESLVKHKCLTCDFFNLYRRISKYLYTEIIAIDLYRVIKGEKIYQAIKNKKKLLTIADIAKAYEKEKEKLDFVFNEFLSKKEKPENIPNIDFIKSQHEVNDKISRLFDYMLTDKNAKTELSIPGIDTIYFWYPEFRMDLPLLLKNKFMIQENGKVKNNKSTKFLAQYFGFQKKEEKNGKWDILNHYFDVDDLKNHFSTNGASLYRKKPCKDYVDWLQIKNTPQGV
jgi:hypothetical protein